MYRKLETNIHRNETLRPRSQLLHSCICERFIWKAGTRPHAASFTVACLGIHKSVWDYVKNHCRWEKSPKLSVYSVRVLLADRSCMVGGGGGVTAYVWEWRSQTISRYQWRHPILSPLLSVALLQSCKIALFLPHLCLLCL